MVIRRSLSGVIQELYEDEEEEKVLIRREKAKVLVFGLLFIVGGTLFICGTVCFFPEDVNVVRADVRLGCRIYDVASLLFAALSLYALVETMGLRRIWLSRKSTYKVRRAQIFEQLMYLVGSILFLLGTAIWDPDGIHYIVAYGGGRSKMWWMVCADVLFMLGSMMFAFASFLNAMNVTKADGYVSYPHVAFMVASCFEFGGIFFVAGTMGFVPGVGCNTTMTILGCWFYLAGSGLYWLGSVLSFIWARAVIAKTEEQLERTIRTRKHKENKAASVIGRVYKEVLNGRRKQAVRSILNHIYGTDALKTDDALEKMEDAFDEDSDDDQDRQDEDSIRSLAMKELRRIKAWFSRTTAGGELGMPLAEA